MRWCRVLSLACVVGFAGGCSTFAGVDLDEVARLTRENQRVIQQIEQVAERASKGELTPQQAEEAGRILARRAAEIAEEIRRAGGGDGSWWEEVLAALAAIAGSLLGVRVWRGSIVARKGTPPPAAPGAA